MKSVLNGELSQRINGWILLPILRECQIRSGLEFPVSLKQIGKFEAKNDISVNVLGLEGKDITFSEIRVAPIQKSIC